jgi:hypothetical protein
MTIQRQYSLPNCTLILEGLSQDTSINEIRPTLSILMNAECHFVGSQTVLSGGPIFFEGLVKSVSAYAQEFLSGIRHPQEVKEGSVKVHLEKNSENNLHRLIVEPDPEINEEIKKIDLNTVQLFDLVEAVDQFFADPQTLPHLSLELQPLSRRYRQMDEPLVKRVAPAALGVASVALVAGGLYFLPIPEVEKPQDTEEVSEATPTETPEPVETPVETPVEPSDVNNGAISENPEDLETLLTNSQEITDPTELRYLQRYLHKTISQAWQDRSQVTSKIEYQVFVAKDGSIVKYEPLLGTPVESETATPLPELKFTPVGGNIANQEQLAQFRVVFNNNVLQINPWHGFNSPPTLGPVVTEPEQLASLKESLYQTLDQAWDKDYIQFNRPLIYRVGITEQGQIADYEPSNQAAFDYEQDIPLPELVRPETAGILPGKSRVPQNPLGQFRVIFGSDGTIEISEWEN